MNQQSGKHPRQVHPASSSDAWTTAAAIEAAVQPPEFQDLDFLVTEFGALADRGTLCTEAFRKAIEACSSAGGGRVVVPAGKYLTGPIHLKSHVHLHLQKGAHLLFSTDPDAYLPTVHTRWEGVELLNYSPLIYAFEQHTIAITGEGVLDGQASEKAWWPWRGEKKWGWQEGASNQNTSGSRNSLFEMGEKEVPVQERRFGAGCFLRPSFVQFYRCQRVLLKNFTLINAPMWAIHPVLCKQVMVHGITVESKGPNVDGCNPESCQDVLIENCRFDVSHDCIALKSGRNADGRRLKVPTARVLIRNCEFSGGHGALTLGSETSGGIQQVFMEHCTSTGQDLMRVFRIKTNANRGGLIEHIYLRKLTIEKASEHVVHINMLYEEHGENLPVIQYIDIQSMRVIYGGKRAIQLDGLEKSPLRHMFFSNIKIFHAVEPLQLKYVDDITFEQVSINGVTIDDLQ